MNNHHFAEALARVIDALGLTPAEFAQQARMNQFEIAHVLAAEPISDQNYRPIFTTILEEPSGAYLAFDLARASMADNLLAQGVDADTTADLIAGMKNDEAIANLFGGLPLLYVVSLAIIGDAFRHSDEICDEFLALAEKCRPFCGDPTIPTGFFHQFSTSTPNGRNLRNTSVADIVAMLRHQGG